MKGNVMRLSEILEAAIMAAIVIVIAFGAKNVFAESSKAEEPKAEEPKAEEPKAEEPKAEAPKVEKPKAAGTSRTAFLGQISDKEMNGQGTAHASDLGVAGLIASSVVETSHAALCNLITVVSPKGGSNRDLGLMSVSDLAAGALVEVPELVDEAGFTVGIVGLNAAIQLTEASWFSTRVLVSGKNLDDFIKKATAANYKVLTQNVSCQSTARQETLAAVAKAVLKAKRALHSM